MHRIVHRSGKVLFEHPGRSLRAAVIAAVAQKINLAGADLTRAYLVGAELANAQLMGTLLEDATLSGANLAGADLTGATINGATLRGTVLPKARLVGALLLSANLQEAYLTNADFTSAGLTGARLQGACLTNTNFDNANLTWAHLTAGKTLGVLATGCLLEYRWAAFAMLNGSRRLRYGCEEHSLEDWRKKAEKVASKYVAACNVPTYTRAILSLVDFVERL